MRRLASIACLLLPLGLLAAPTQKPKATAPLGEKPAHHRTIAATTEQATATGKLALPSVGLAVKELKRALSARAVPRERSLLHVNLRHDVQLAFVSAPYWTTTTPHAPATFSFPLISLRW